MLPYDEKWCHYHRDLSRLLEPKSVGWCTSNTQVLTPHLNVICRLNSVLGDSQKWLGEILVRWRVAYALKEILWDFKTVRFRYVLGIVRNTGSNPVLTTKKNKKRFGRLKNLTYLCRTNNGGRKVRNGCPTPVRKGRSSLTFEILWHKKRETRKVYQPVNIR
jgi:hypothetical protein